MSLLLLFLHCLFILDHTRVYKHKYVGVHARYTRARYAYVCGVHARSHLDRTNRSGTRVRIYIYTTRITVQREKRENTFSGSTRVFWPRKPLFALHCVYMYGIISTKWRAFWTRENVSIGLGESSGENWLMLGRKELVNYWKKIR